jgi:hypothetical protein
LVEHIDQNGMFGPLFFSGFYLLSLQEGVMIEVTPSATEQIAEYFKGKEVSPIRIFLNEGG